MAFDLSKKNILITGAGRGIGRALATAIVKAGGVVYAVSKTKANLETLVEECGGENIHPIHVDLGDWENTRKVLECLEPMDGLVNNAGVISAMVSALETPKEDIENTFSINIMAAVNVTQVIGRKMVAAGKGGSIINVSSINGLIAMKNCMAYSMSKAALDMMTKQFALELGPHKIRVNSLNPTIVLTDMTREFWGKPVNADKLKGYTPLGRFSEVDEVVGPMMYLLSDYSTMVTGTINPVEGGLLSNILCNKC